MEQPEEFLRALQLYERMNLSWVQRISSCGKIPKYEAVISKVPGLAFPLAVRFVCGLEREFNDGHGGRFELTPEGFETISFIQVEHCVTYLREKYGRHPYSASYGKVGKGPYPGFKLILEETGHGTQRYRGVVNASVPFKSPDPKCPGCQGSGIEKTGVVVDHGFAETIPCDCTWLLEDYQDTAYRILSLLRMWAAEK